MRCAEWDADSGYRMNHIRNSAEQQNTRFLPQTIYKQIVLVDESFKCGSNTFNLSEKKITHIKQSFYFSVVKYSVNTTQKSFPALLPTKQFCHFTEYTGATYMSRWINLKNVTLREKKQVTGIYSMYYLLIKFYNMQINTLY